MGIRQCVFCVSCALMMLAPARSAAEEHPWAGAYVSMISGAAHLDADDERAGEVFEAGMPLAAGDRLTTGRAAFVEIAFRNGVRAWIDGDTDVSVQRVFSWPALVLEQGALFVHVPDYFTDDTYIEIAGGDAYVTVRPGSLACINHGGTSAAVVDLWVGQAFVAAADYSVSLYSSQRVRLTHALEFVVSDFAASPGIRFEVQSLARYRSIQAAQRRERLEQPLQGIDVLEDHGSWYYDDEFDGRVWRPYVSSGWRPFYNGRWLHHPRGAYWIAHDPWGSVTYQYGNWRYSRRGYWCWVPGYAFTPAAVRFYSAGDYFFWVPLGMHTRFTYGTLWPYDYYRYSVMCRRDALYKKRGRYCSPGRRRGNIGCDDSAVTRPRPGSRREELREVSPRILPEPERRRKREADEAPDPMVGKSRQRREERMPRERQPATRRPDRRQERPPAAVPVERERTTRRQERVSQPGIERSRRSVESDAGQRPGFNPQPAAPRSREREVQRLPGGVRHAPERNMRRGSTGRSHRAGPSSEHVPQQPGSTP